MVALGRKEEGMLVAVMTAGACSGVYISVSSVSPSSILSWLVSGVYTGITVSTVSPSAISSLLVSGVYTTVSLVSPSAISSWYVSGVYTTVSLVSPSNSHCQTGFWLKIQHFANVTHF